MDQLDINYNSLYRRTRSTPSTLNRTLLPPASSGLANACQTNEKICDVKKTQLPKIVNWM